MGITDKNFGVRAEYAVDDDFILPKCVAVIDVTSDRIIRLLTTGGTTPNIRGAVAQDILSRIEKLKRVYANPDIIFAPDAEDAERMYSKGLGYALLAGSGLIEHGTNRAGMVCFRVPFSELMQHMCNVLGVAYESDMYMTHNKTDNPGEFVWSRFAIAYSVIGDDLAGVEYANSSTGDTTRGMGIYFSFHTHKGGTHTSNTMIRLYVYDMSMRPLRDFVGSAVVGPDVMYGARIMKHEINSIPEMFDTVDRAGMPQNRVEAFHSGAHYLRIGASVDVKQHRYERLNFGTLGPYNPVKPHPYGFVSGTMTEHPTNGYRCALYSGFEDTRKLATFVHTWTNEAVDTRNMNDLAGSGHISYYEPTYIISTPLSEPTKLYVTGTTLTHVNGGPIVQKMPHHMFFADVSGIDRYLSHRYGNDPKKAYPKNNEN